MHANVYKEQLVACGWWKYTLSSSEYCFCRRQARESGYEVSLIFVFHPYKEYLLTVRILSIVQTGRSGQLTLKALYEICCHCLRKQWCSVCKLSMTEKYSFYYGRLNVLSDTIIGNATTAIFCCVCAKCSATFYVTALLYYVFTFGICFRTPPPNAY